MAQNQTGPQDEFYICDQCGRTLKRLDLFKKNPKPKRCVTCEALPEWFKDPHLSRTFDPEHSGSYSMPERES